MVTHPHLPTMEIIIPAAGASTRFPDLKPKYLLTAYDGELMIEKSLTPYLGKHPIWIGILQEHETKYGVLEIFNSIFGEMVNVVVIPEFTRGPADTVLQIIKNGKINLESSILIKDCDSFFTHPTKLTNGNHIYVDSLTNNPEIRAAANKSYVNVNDQMIVNNIIEKKIVSEWFCVGGYQFSTARVYVDICENLLNQIKTEIYVSAVIDYMLSFGIVFSAKTVKNWVDVGTKDDWHKYNNKPTIFCDIDGTIVENQSPWGENNYNTTPVPLQKNIDILLQAVKNGGQIIFTTSRSLKYQQVTQQLLADLGFGNCQLIMNLHHSKRILINDYAPSNPFPSAVAINLARNTNTLKDQL